MTDSKKKTREQILGELESIQQLLNDEQLPEPPLLTDTDAPLLTEAIDDQEADWEPPILREVLEDPATGQEPHSPAAAGVRPAEAVDSRAVPEEQQPGLFDAGHESPSAESSAQDAEAAQQRAASDDGTTGTTLPKSENPFLPKHIRDRLTANRLLQAELVKSMGQVPAAAHRPQATTAVSAQTMEALVDELVQRFLPQLEAELRRRLRELVAEVAEDDPPTG